MNCSIILSIEVDRRIRNAWCSFRKYTLELYDRPSALLEFKIRMLRDEVLETMLYRLRHAEPARVPLRHAAPSPPQVLDSLHRLREHNRADHPISYLDTLVKTESESIEATLRRRRFLFAGFVARMEDTRLPKCVMFGELVGGASCVGARKKSGWGVSWTTSELSASTPTSGRLQSRTRGNGAERQNKGRNISWQNGSLQKKPRLDYSMQWYARSDGKDEGEDSPKQAGSCWFARPC